MSDDQLSCSICLSRYDAQTRVPRLLPACLHTFCEICLPNLYTSDYIICPTCRIPNQIELRNVPKNRYILQFIDYVATESHTTQSTTQLTTAQESDTTSWDGNRYLRVAFDEMDLNGDGKLTAHELQKALRQAGSEFSLRTVELLMNKYDSNGDKEIAFDEFIGLFHRLNDDYEQFVMFDLDASGHIDYFEFKESLKSKGYEFSDDFYEHMMTMICTRTRSERITFDTFMRVSARLDYMKELYNDSAQYQRKPMNQFLRKYFFDEFW